MYLPDQQKRGNTMSIADKDYYLDEAGEPTTDQSKAALIIAHKGAEVTPDMAAKYPQIKTTDAKEETDPAQEEVAKRRADEEAEMKKRAAESKLANAPAENKSVK